MEEEARIPTALWLDAHIRRISAAGLPYYIVNKGAYAAGTVLLKLYAPGRGCKVLTQQRDLDGKMGWAGLFDGEVIEETKADAYIQRSVGRDPDLWVVEIEDRDLNNPFEDKN